MDNSDASDLHERKDESALIENMAEIEEPVEY
jgi:hypothetical protein